MSPGAQVVERHLEGAHVVVEAVPGLGDLAGLARVRRDGEPAAVDSRREHADVLLGRVEGDGEGAGVAALGDAQHAEDPRLVAHMPPVSLDVDVQLVAEDLEDAAVVEGLEGLEVAGQVEDEGQRLGLGRRDALGRRAQVGVAGPERQGCAPQGGGRGGVSGVLGQLRSRGEGGGVDGGGARDGAGDAQRAGGVAAREPEAGGLQCVAGHVGAATGEGLQQGEPLVGLAEVHEHVGERRGVTRVAGDRAAQGRQRGLGEVGARHRERQRGALGEQALGRRIGDRASGDVALGGQAGPPRDAASDHRARVVRGRLCSGQELPRANVLRSRCGELGLRQQRFGPERSACAAVQQNTRPCLLASDLLQRQQQVHVGQARGVGLQQQLLEQPAGVAIVALRVADPERAPRGGPQRAARQRRAARRQRAAPSPRPRRRVLGVERGPRSAGRVHRRQLER